MRCPDCNGRGYTLHERHISGGVEEHTCNFCGGSGDAKVIKRFKQDGLKYIAFEGISGQRTTIPDKLIGDRWVPHSVDD